MPDGNLDIEEIVSAYKAAKREIDKEDFWKALEKSVLKGTMLLEDALKIIDNIGSKTDENNDESTRTYIQNFFRTVAQSSFYKDNSKQTLNVLDVFAKKGVYLAGVNFAECLSIIAIHDKSPKSRFRANAFLKNVMKKLDDVQQKSLWNKLSWQDYHICKRVDERDEDVKAYRALTRVFFVFAEACPSRVDMIVNALLVRAIGNRPRFRKAAEIAFEKIRKLYPEADIAQSGKPLRTIATGLISATAKERQHKLQLA